MASMSWIVALALITVAVALAGAIVKRRLMLYLLGPVFFYETMRLSRRPRLFWLRIAYAGTLLVLLFLIFNDQVGVFSTTLHASEVPIERLRKLNSDTFSAFLTVQVIAVFLLTPIYTATTIVEERERRTLELLYICGITNREIVIGKLAARMLQVFGLLLTGLPVLGLLQLLGGVDPNLVIAGFLMTTLFALTLGSLGLEMSLAARSPFGSISRTYLVGLFLSLFDFALLGILSEATSPLVFFFLAALCALLQTVLATLLVWDVTRRLRVVEQTADTAKPGRRSPWSDRPAPPLEFIVPRPRPPSRPLKFMLWKERYIERSLLQRSPMLLGCLAMIFATIGVPFSIWLLSWIADGWTGQDTNERVRWVSIVFFAPAPFLVGLGAAGRISRERERQTLDNFLTTPLTRHEVLLGKALAAVADISYLLGLVAVVWLVGVLSGGLHFFVAPFLVGAGVIHVAFAAALGLFCSAYCGSTVRAMIVTVVTLLAVNFVPLFLGELGYVLSPPGALWNLCLGYHYSKLDNPVAAFLATTLLFGPITVLLWWRTRRALDG
jgi:ABC-type transport system involved in multi-copper enzyme maturation permease subunit